MQKQLYILLVSMIVIYGLWMAIGTTNDKSDKIEDANKAAEVNRTITLLAVGDINLGRLTGQKIIEGDNNYAFEYLNEYLQKFDITFGNLESQLAELGGETQSPTNEYRFAGPPGGADGLKEAGFDIVSTANNHMWDYGKTALFETMDNLDRVNVKYVGSARETNELYKPVIIEVEGKKVAFLATTMILNGYEKAGAADYVAMADTEKLLPAIVQAKTEADFVVVSMHGGVEYRASPIQAQKDLAHKIIDAGANIVIGHHSHTANGVEEYKNGLIFYSLGNFAFWQPFGYWTEHSFIAEIELRPNGEVDYNPIAVDSGWQPRLSVDTDATKILQYIAELSSKLNPPEDVNSID
ncbi:CapA family protein [Patescibacteria group bacterium]|nr:CapA family protein [Patescibacteria group bacterium]